MSLLDTEVGKCYKNFVWTKVHPIEELSCVLYELKHEPTGASIMHIACEDPENVFCLGLQTWPDSSNGVAHILEHTVLCGSKKFPVKDPFFGMTRRSLNTFMNAFTGQDFTCYPAASLVEQDFYNLLEVYCDAVFFPELKEMSFLQEGHRFEFQTPNDATTPLLYQGIVYNEMKGAMSSPDSRMWKAINKHLLPELTYAYNSGGDPDEIPNLTYQGLKDFHAKYYHPSRCTFYFYGNLSIEKHLDFLQTHVFSKVEAVDPLPPMPSQTRFKAPVVVNERYPAQENDTTIATFSWLTTKPTQVEDTLALTLLDSVLTDNDASPLKRALLESKLCTMADSFLDIETSEIPFVIICKGCQDQDVEPLKNVILNTLERLSHTGIDPQMAQSALHQLEFERLEIGGGGYPFGLSLFFRSGLLKQHGGKPENGLQIYTLFEKLQAKIQDPQYLGGLIRHYLLDNPHFVQVSLHPDSNLENEEAQNEREKLDRIAAGLSEKEKETIIAKASQLKAFQLENEMQSLECLPKIHLSDVPKETFDYPLQSEDFENLTVFHHETFTNHIIYSSLVFDLPDISEDDLPYVQLLVSILTELGAADRNYAENLSYIQEHIGGISLSLNLHPQRGNCEVLKPALILRGKALMRNRKHLFGLLKDFTLTARVDEEARIKELILQICTHLQQRLNQNAMGYATLLSTSHLSKLGSINDKWGGLTYFKFMERLGRDIDQHMTKLLQKFEQIKKALFHCHKPHLVLSCDQETYEVLKKEHFYGISKLPVTPMVPFSLQPTALQGLSQGRPISAPVAFTSMGFKTIDSNDERAAYISIATELFDNKILHPKIREQGGAYGSGSSYNATTGSFYFYAYRDPQLKNTIDAFQLAAKEIATGNFTEDDLDEAKLGLVQHFDAPSSPGSRAYTAYVWQRENKVLSWRQNFRNKVLTATKKEIVDAVKTALIPKLESGCVVSFASKKLLEKENKKMARPLPILPL